MIELKDILKWITALSVLYNEKKDYLTELDSAIGDADHGINMSRGFSAVVVELENKVPQDIAEVCKLIAMALIKNVGGAAGPLYGTFFLKMSKDVEGKQQLALDDIFSAFASGYAGLVERGKANVGDKTMLDVWYPVVEKLKEVKDSSLSITEAMNDVVEVAEKNMLQTKDMIAKKGRASYLGERSIGHQDPGATSSYFMLKTAFENWQ